MRALSRLLTPVVLFVVGGLIVVALGPVSPSMQMTAETDIACDADGVGFTTEVDSTPNTIAVTINGVDSVACAGLDLVVGIGKGATQEFALAYFRALPIQPDVTSYRFPISTLWTNAFDPITGALGGNPLPLPLSVAQFQWLSVDAIKTSTTPTPTPTTPSPTPTTPTPSPTTPTPTPTSPSPTTTPTATPTPAEPPSTPLNPGSGTLEINGVSVPVVVTADPGASTFTISGAGISIQLSSKTSDGQPLRVSPDGSLLISTDGPVTLNASGYAEGSTVTLWMYSTPILLGTFPVNANGVAAVTVADLSGIPPGPHTLQVLGKNASGAPVTLNIGVVVAEEKVLVSGKPKLVLSKTRAKPGEKIKATASQVRPGCRVQFWIKGTTIKATANAFGKRTVVMRMPKTPGTYRLTLRVIPQPSCSAAWATNRTVLVR